MTTTEPLPTSVHPTVDHDPGAELVRLVYDGTFDEVHRDLRDLLLDPIFDPREDLTTTERGRLAYERARLVHARLERPRDIVANPLRLFALAEWPSLLDVSLFSLLMVHYNLCLGTVVEHSTGRADLDDYVDELDSLASFGTYMATELGYGNNVAALRTTAVYDAASQTFVLNTPEVLAQKFMSYSGFEDIPKLAVVMARLQLGGTDWGVFPFVVRISGHDGLCAGVHAAACPEKPVQGLDNGVTRFDDVRLPRRSLLTGDMAELTDDDQLRPMVRNPRRRFLRAMIRIQPGRLCVASAALGAGRASVYIALRYARGRIANAPSRSDMPIIGHRSHQLPLFTALAQVYGLGLLLNGVKRRYVEQPGRISTDLGSDIAITKALCTWAMTDVVGVCRERCGAQGMFSVNRIADYVSLLQGLVTAEGDSQVLLATTAAQLLAQPDQGPAPLGDLRGDPSSDLRDPATQLTLMHRREQHLVRTCRSSLHDETRAEPYFDAWNRTANTALAMARLRGARMAQEQFVGAVAEAQDDEVRAALRPLAALYGLAEIRRDAGWYAGRGLLTAQQIDDLPGLADELCAVIEPHVELLVDGFCLSPEVLRAPIAHDDYVAAFQRTVGAHG